MTLLYYDPRFLEHDTGQHPEQPERLRQIVGRLDERGLVDHARVRASFASGDSDAMAEVSSRQSTTPTPMALSASLSWESASRERLERVHAPHAIDRVAEVAASGGGMMDSDTVVSAASFDVARLAAGATCDAVERVVGGQSKTALCLVRPPGHHALSDRAMGFCLFNNTAAAVRVATEEQQLDRVLIVDWDVHHGNGTQDAFYADGRVGFFSAHRWPFYPGTGAADETGTGDGLGTTRNLPIAFGTPRARYRELFARGLEDFADRIRPQLVLVSAGFDAHRADPVGSLGLEVEDFVELTRLVLDVAEAHAGGRIVSVLEGGYNPSVLAECVEAHLRALMDGETHPRSSERPLR